MFAQSDKIPNEKGFELSKSGNLADVRFFENVTEVRKNEETRYEYDTYFFNTEFYEGIESEIEADFESWKQKAKNTMIKTETQKLTVEEMALALLEAQDALDFLIMGGI